MPKMPLPELPYHESLYHRWAAFVAKRTLRRHGGRVSIGEITDLEHLGLIVLERRGVANTKRIDGQDRMWWLIGG